MTTATSPITIGAQPSPTSTLVTLARADARRFAMHPLFLFPAVLLLVMMVASVAEKNGGGAAPMWVTLLIAFLFGVFGFVVAHRLTTSLQRSGDLAETAPVGARQRTAAMCLACLVPGLAGSVVILFMIVTAALWPPVGVPATAPVAWFADEPDLAILAALVATGPVAAVGGSLLGVAVARWAPFRGSALLGMVVLVVGTTMPSEMSNPWRTLAPWIISADETAVDGKVVSSSLVAGISHQWYLGYVLCLCGLAVVAALLRDPGNRRPLVWIGAALMLGAAGCFALTVS